MKRNKFATKLLKLFLVTALRAEYSYCGIKELIMKEVKHFETTK